MVKVSLVAPVPASVLVTVADTSMVPPGATVGVAVLRTEIPAWITSVDVIEAVAVAFTLNWSVAVTVTVSVTTPVVVGV
jgi:hypothetical protein